MQFSVINNIFFEIFLTSIKYGLQDSDKVSIYPEIVVYPLISFWT